MHGNAGTGHDVNQQLWNTATGVLLTQQQQVQQQMMSLPPHLQQQQQLMLPVHLQQQQQQLVSELPLHLAHMMQPSAVQLQPPLNGMLPVEPEGQHGNHVGGMGGCVGGGLRQVPPAPPQAPLAPMPPPPPVSASAQQLGGSHNRSQQQQPPTNQQQRKQQQQQPAQRAGQRQPQRSQQQSLIHARLSANITCMVQRVSPSEVDTQARELMMGFVREACNTALPEFAQQMQVLPFGSYVSGLGTKDSDLDVVITGVLQPKPGEGFYSKHDRPVVANLLNKVSRELRRQQGLVVRNLFVIRNARIPLVKLTASLATDKLSSQQRKQVLGQEVPPLSIDISMTTDAGPQAAQYLASQVSQHPPLRPLSIALKAFLKAHDLNEVVSGGLSSYGLTYLIIAHLMAEADVGSDMSDLGRLMHRFLIRYGRDFDSTSLVVSVKDGGVVHRSEVRNIKYENLDRICCIDPLTGRNITEGAFCSRAVLHAMRQAADLLDKLTRQHTQACPPYLDVLGQLLSMELINNHDEPPEDDDYCYLEPPAKRERGANDRDAQQAARRQYEQLWQSRREEEEEWEDQGAGHPGSKLSRDRYKPSNPDVQAQPVMYGYQYPTEHEQARTGDGSHARQGAGVEAGPSGQGGASGQHMSAKTSRDAEQGQARGPRPGKRERGGQRKRPASNDHTKHGQVLGKRRR